MNTLPPQPTVVAGYDGSPAGEAAARWAAREAARRNAPLRLVHALSLPLLGSSVGLVATFQVEPLENAARQLLDTTRQRLLMAHPDLEIELVVSVGGATTVLLDEASSAALLVLGSRGLGEVRDLALGSVTTHLATHAPCPVVAVPAGWKAGPRTQAEVVVGVDGSEHSMAAVDFAFDQAQSSGARLTAVLAWEAPVWSGPGELVPLVYDPEELEQENAALLAESLAGRGDKYPDVTVSPKLVNGYADDVLVEAAASAQLLVVGSRGRGAFRGMLLGSVSRSMLHHAKCPVAVVR